MVYVVDVTGCGELSKPEYDFKPIPRVVLTCEGPSTKQSEEVESKEEVVEVKEEVTETIPETPTEAIPPGNATGEGTGGNVTEPDNGGGGATIITLLE